jgi:hypothetical protein
MTKQLDILMTDEERNFTLDVERLRCSCGRHAVLQRGRIGNTVRFKVHCETGELYRKICQIRRQDPEPCPDTGWHPTLQKAVAVWKAMTVLSR